MRWMGYDVIRRWWVYEIPRYLMENDTCMTGLWRSSDAYFGVDAMIITLRIRSAHCADSVD